MGFCENCGSSDVVEKDALFYCKRCGDQIEGAQVLDLGGQGLMETGLGSEQKKKNRLKKRWELKDADVPVCQLGLFTEILGSVAQALLSIGFPSSIPERLHSIWSDLLYFYRVLPGLEGEGVNKLTDLPPEFHENICKLTLDGSLLVTLAYFAVLAESNGAVWLSDVCRWFWEGRIPQITSKQRTILDQVSRTYKLREGKVPVIPSEMRTSKHLSEWWGSVEVLAATAGFWTDPFDLDLLQICRSFIHRVNLPTSLLSRVSFLLKKFSPKMELSQDRLRAVLYDQMMAVGHAGFAPELKAAVYVLLAMKLIFKLDDAQEFELSDWAQKRNVEAGLSAERVFVFTDWMVQMKLRSAAVQGEPVHRVLRWDWFQPADLPSTQLSSLATRRGLRCCSIAVPPSTSSKERLVGSPLEEPQPPPPPLPLALAPLRAVAEFESGRWSSDPELDSENVRRFFLDFSKDSLNFSSDGQENDSNSFFPSASSYLTFPRRNFESFFIPFFDGRTRNCPKNCPSQSFDDLKPHLPQNFCWLLDFLATVIGDEAAAIYRCLLILEENILQIPIPVLEENNKHYKSRIVHDIF